MIISQFKLKWVSNTFWKQRVSGVIVFWKHRKCLPTKFFRSKNKTSLGANGRPGYRQEYNFALFPTRSSFKWTGLDRNLPSCCSGSCVFAIICHMATVLWVQAEMCDGSVHSLAPHRRRHLPVAALPSPPANFHYPGGIQGVMASRAAAPASWAWTFPADCSGEAQKEMGTEC